MSKWASVLLAILVGIGGCMSAPPPEHLTNYPLLSDHDLLAAMSRQLHSLHDVSAQGELHLTEPSGDQVTLDLAMAIRPPNEARVRAWKFGQAVFDLTVNSDGVWLLSDDRHAGQLQITSAQLARVISLLNGGILDDSSLIAHDEGDRTILTRHVTGEPDMRCTIDRPTRTIRKYELLDEQRVVQLSLSQSQFVEHDSIAWPQHLVAISDRGTIDITLHDVDLNGGLPPEAFRPPHRATRLP